MPTSVRVSSLGGTSGRTFGFLLSGGRYTTLDVPGSVETDAYGINDAGWIMFLIPWPPFSAWCIGVAVAVYRDRRDGDERTFPRWVGYLNLWVAMLFLPSGLVLFFKTGPFAWNGICTFWLAATVFTIWLVAMLVVVLRAIRQQETEQLGRHAI